MKATRSFPMTAPAASVVADMQPVINALGNLPQAALMQAVLTAIQALPKPSTKAREVVVNLAGGLANSAVDLGTLTSVQAITVRDLTGAQVPTLKLGGAGESPLTLAKDDVLDGFSVTQLLLNCPPGGGSLTLVIFGR